MCARVFFIICEGCCPAHAVELHVRLLEGAAYVANTVQEGDLRIFLRVEFILISDPLPDQLEVAGRILIEVKLRDRLAVFHCRF